MTMPDNVQDGDINLDLLLGTVDEAPRALDFYAAGIYAVQEVLSREGSAAPKWLIECLDTLGGAYADTTETWVKEKVEASLKSLEDGGSSSAPAWACPWDTLINIWTKGSPETLLTPISHCLKTIGDRRAELPSVVYPKLILGIIFGDIGAAIHLARQSGVAGGFEAELKSTLGKKATIKDLLDLYYMFGLCAELLRAGHQVEVLGTAGQPEGGPDFKFTSSTHGQVYFVEANRKEPLKDQAEKDLVWAAIDEKAEKVAPEKGAAGLRWEPCLLAVDITSIARPGSTEDLDVALLSRGSCGEYVYRGYADPDFNLRLKACADAMGVAAVRTALLRRNGYAVGGILLTRHQYLQIDATGIAQAGGTVLVLHRDFESRIPACIARHIYLVDDACIPAELL